MLEIKFIFLDEENGMIHVEHDGIEVWQESRPDWDSYLTGVMPRGVPVLLTTDVAEQEAAEELASDDARDYPQGKGTDARLKRWLVDNRVDMRVREDGTAQVTEQAGEIYWWLFQVAERMYWHGVEDVRERYGIR
jgi:hypothetical protein